VDRNIRALVVVLVGSLALTGAVFAADRIDVGRREFLNKCAACHGESARGDGAVAGSLRVAPSDLTTLAKRNGGVFPSDRVHQVIDGRESVKAHGTRDMPVWGNVLAAEGSGATKSNSDVPVDMEVEVRTRILALIDFLKRIQTK
jgi:mono/diheme cytochrome c family protein